MSVPLFPPVSSSRAVADCPARIGTSKTQALSDCDMLGPAVAGGGVLVALVLVSWLFKRVRGGSADEQQSRARHRAAQERDPPVDIGDVEEVAIREFSDHHSGERRAVGKVEGFVVFVEDVPDACEVTDVIRIKILSYNRGHTSATATHLETV